MSTELDTVPVNENALVNIDTKDLVAPGIDDAALASFGSGGEYLPRLQLCGASTNLCKEGKQPIGTFAIVVNKDTHEDLGKDANVWVLGLRLKALEIKDGTPISFFDHTTPEFRRIASLAGVQDSGCMAGPEYLVYIPAKKRFATYFLSSPSSQNEHPKLKAQLGKAVKLLVTLAENKKKQKWHVHKVVECSVPLESPAMDLYSAVLTKFKNPQASKMTAAPAEESERPR